MKNLNYFLMTTLVFTLILGCKKDEVDNNNNNNSPGVTVTDNEGNVYNTVTIGTQTWMKENLKVNKYRNGDTIPTTTSKIPGDSTPKYQWAYKNDNSNVAIYGRLYTWTAVTDSRNVCPAGWHVPSDSEWTTLTDYLGGETVAGGKMKEAGTSHWIYPNLGGGNNVADNSSGFTALPGGYLANGMFDGVGVVGHWWSATNGNRLIAWSIYLKNELSEARSGYTSKSLGYSVRCLRD